MRPVSQFIIQFQTLASEVRWNEEALISAFWNGLSDRLKDDLVPLDLPPKLGDLMSLCTKLDLRHRERQMEKT